MAKKADGCTSLLVVGVAVFILGSLFNGGCSSRKRAASVPLPAYASPSLPQAPLADTSSQPLAPATDKDGNPILNPERYVPKTVVLKQPLKVWDGKAASGSKTVATGTELPLKGVYGYKVMIEVDGRTEIVPADSTDLLDQMVRATGDD